MRANVSGTAIRVNIAKNVLIASVLGKITANDFVAATLQAVTYTISIARSLGKRLAIEWLARSASSAHAGTAGASVTASTTVLGVVFKIHAGTARAEGLAGCAWAVRSCSSD